MRPTSIPYFGPHVSLSKIRVKLMKREVKENKIKILLYEKENNIKFISINFIFRT